MCTATNGAALLSCSSIAHVWHAGSFLNVVLQAHGDRHRLESSAYVFMNNLFVHALFTHAIISTRYVRNVFA